MLTRRWPLLAAAAVFTAVAVALVMTARTDPVARHEIPPQPITSTDAPVTTTVTQPSAVRVRITSAPAALQLWMESIAQHDGPRACVTMTGTAQRQLAAALGAPDCMIGIARLADQVHDQRRYLLYGYSAGTYQYPARPHDPVVLDGCSLTWGDLIDGQQPAPGPLPGRMTLTEDSATGLVVSDWRPCTSPPAPVRARTTRASTPSTGGEW